MNPSTASMVHVVESEIRRGVEVPRGIMIGLQRALEWVTCCSTTRRVGLFMSHIADLVAHQAIVVLVDLLSSPDSESD